MTRTLTPNGYHMIPMEQRAAVDGWLNDKGFAPSDVTQIAITGPVAIVSVLERDEHGNAQAVDDHVLTRTVRTTAMGVPSLDRWC